MFWSSGSDKKPLAGPLNRKIGRLFNGTALPDVYQPDELVRLVSEPSSTSTQISIVGVFEADKRSSSGHSSREET